MNSAGVNVVPDTDLPLELRGALDVIALELTDSSGTILAEVIGPAALVGELSLYAQITPSPDVLILLAAEPGEAAAAIDSTTATEIWTLAAGWLDSILGPLRSRSGSRVTFSKQLADDQWRNRGFERRANIGLQGLGSIAWAFGERICRRIDRPDLADRCRIGMLRTLIAARPLSLGTIVVTQYRRSVSG